MTFLVALAIAATQTFAQVSAATQDAGTEQPASASTVITLPPPATQGGKPLQEALSLRKSGRQYSEREVSMETLSSMLWSGFGISRPDGRRTAPTARNVQDIDIYVVRKDGAFRYDAQNNSLALVTTNDIRSVTSSTQDFARRAPLNLLYVQTLKNQTQNLGADLTGGLHAGAISQNVRVFCASEGLENVVRLLFDANALAKALGLPAEQRVLLTHSIGYAP